jgi:hypothetical protein
MAEHCKCSNPMLEGVELRDLFACFAMLKMEGAGSFDIKAGFCYAMADEMLEARKISPNK